MIKTILKFKNYLDEQKSKKSNIVDSKEILVPTTVLLEWKTVDRITKERSKYSMRKISVIALFIAFVFLILKDFWLIVIVGVVYFVIYVFLTAPANEVTHKITNNGVLYAGEKLYRWNELRNFFLEKRDNTRVLVINTVDVLPGRLFLILTDEIDTNNIISILNEHLSILEESQKSPIDKLVSMLANRLRI